jgi:hypothetical protein
VPFHKQILSVFVWIMGLPSHQLRQERPNPAAAYVRHRPETTLLFHGVFAPNSKYRAKITPARRGTRNKCYLTDDVDKTPAEKRASMTWAKRLRRVFNIEVETCDKCGADVRIIASIEDPAVIQKILAHLDDNVTSVATAQLPDCRASPTVSLFV